MKIRLTQLDGKLPNLALMKLAHWHRSQGDDISLYRTPTPNLFEPQYDKVYGSAIFGWTQPVTQRLLNAYPDAVIGGTGSSSWRTVEELIGVDEYENYDYADYPEFPFSMGFTQRGCRLNCGFCVVPKKEGRPRSTNSIYDIWRKDKPRCLILLDNDFFGQPKEDWRARIDEIIEGDFKVSFNQGINVRLINDEAAAAIASVRYSDDQFQTKRLYTAWDNVGQEKIFTDGIARLMGAGIDPHNIMVYMLIGYNKEETWEDIFYRYRIMKNLGVIPFPMVFNNVRKDLKRFQRWVIRRYDQIVPWEEFGKPRRTIPIEANMMALDH